MPHWKPKSAVTFRELADGLWMFSAVDSGSKRGKTYCCYLLRSGVGNLMLHPPDSPGFYAVQAERIDGLGGIQHVAMTHTGDLNFGWGAVWRRWRPRMHGHSLEIARLPAQAAGLPFEPLADRLGDIEVVQLPGHTPGYVGFVGAHGGRRRLFCGHLMVEGVTGWRSTSSQRLIGEGRSSVARFESLDVDDLMPEYAWTRELPDSLPPVPFGPEVRRRAVEEALAAFRPRGG